VWLVVGLGNPGREYASHRHNVGFLVVEELASRLRADAFRDKFSAQWTKGSKGDEQVVLLQPQTFMNESGRSVQPAAAFFKVEPGNVLVVHDELDLPFGDVRLKMGGGHAGHNGLRSIIQHLGTSDFPRLRFGVGRPPPGFRGEVADFVLSGFDGDERVRLVDLVTTAAEAAMDVFERGLQPAANRLNTKDSAKAKAAAEKKAARASSENRSSPPAEKAPVRS
jgi:PTH1 family peptidyl-tRNA hydrolase